MHPLITDLDSLSDNELDQKIIDLNRKYWQTNNPYVQSQIGIALQTYKDELQSRRIKQKLASHENNGDNDLDNLIKIS